MRQPRTRSLRRQKLRDQGMPEIQVKQVWCVSVENTKILPLWLKQRVIPGLKSLVGIAQFWLFPSDAMALAQFFTSIHVSYSILKLEFRRCQVCGRPMIGKEAASKREAIEANPNARTEPCREQCEKDRDSRLWRILGNVA